MNILILVEKEEIDLKEYFLHVGEILSCSPKLFIICYSLWVFEESGHKTKIIKPGVAGLIALQHIHRK